MNYVYTSIANGWDNLRVPAAVSQSPNVRYICFTNIPNLPSVGPWEFRPLVDVGDSARTSRLPKILPHLMLPADAECSIYHDGNFQLSKRPEEIIETVLAQHDWAAHVHPARNCAYKEAAVLLKEGIGTAELVMAQIQRYRDADFPQNDGLWANGFLVRRHTEAVKTLCETWWHEFAAGCERDQVSFPFSRRRSGVEVNTLPDAIYNSPYMHFYWHGAWKERECNFEFVPGRKRVNSSIERLREIAGIKGLQFPVYEAVQA